MNRLRITEYHFGNFPNANHSDFNLPKKRIASTPVFQQVASPSVPLPSTKNEKPFMRWEIQEDQIEVQTPAKLNLYLEVLGKRDDGFHELETIMTAIDLYDLIRIRKQDTNESSEQIRLNCKWSVVDRFYKSTAEKRGTELETDEPFGDLPTDESNLVFRAAQLFFGETGIEACVEIELLKLIPSVAGLGGASGNAAGTLLAINRLFGSPVPKPRIFELAAELGSDVPFFVNGGTAICRGRGEKTTQLSSFAKLHFVVIRPYFGLSTKSVFSKLDLPKDVKRLNIQSIQHFGENWKSSLFNRLQDPALFAAPEIGEIIETLNQSGCVASQMTGSGSSCFGLCESHQQAKKIADQLRSKRIGFVYCCQNLPDFSVPF